MHEQSAQNAHNIYTAFELGIIKMIKLKWCIKITFKWGQRRFFKQVLPTRIHPHTAKKKTRKQRRGSRWTRGGHSVILFFEKICNDWTLICALFSEMGLIYKNPYFIEVRYYLHFQNSMSKISV